MKNSGMNNLREVRRIYSEVARSNSLDCIKRNSNKGNSARGLAGIEAPCRAAKYILKGVADEDGLFPHYKTFCKSYNCEFCGPRKRALIRHAIALAIEKYKLISFATLTLDPKTCKCGPEGSAKYIRRAWNKFRVLQKREFNRGLEFVAVIEFQKNGYAHLHIVFDRYIPHTWLKEKWVNVGGGKIVDVRKCDAKASYYLAKYLGKELLPEYAQKIRRYSTSKNINLNRLLKENRKNDGSIYEFVKISEQDARDILKEYIEADILDPKDHILGFKASKSLNTEHGEAI